MQKISLKNTPYRYYTLSLTILVAVMLIFSSAVAEAKENRSNGNAFVISKKTSRSEKAIRLKLSSAWKHKLGVKTPWGKLKKIGLHGSSPRPTLSSGTLYIGTTKKVFYAFDLKSGDKRWKFKTASAIDGDAAVKDDMVCFGTVAGVLHCLDKNTGKELWSFNARSEIITAPVILKDFIYFTSTEDRVYALNRKSGKKVWSYSGIAPHYVMPRIVTSPIVRDTEQGRKIFVLLANGSLTCLDGERGKELWTNKVLSSQINTVERARRRVEATETELFVIDDRGVVVVIAQSDGKAVREYPLVKTVDFTIKDGKLYLLGEELLLAVDIKTKNVSWLKDLTYGKTSVLELSGDHLLVVSMMTEVPFDFKYLTQHYGNAAAYHIASGNESMKKRFKAPLTATEFGEGTLAVVNSKGVLRVFDVE